MSSKFKPITLAWRGKKLTIAANRVMGAIARIEDYVTIVELQHYAAKKTLPMAKLAEAFAAVIEYAGGQVTAEEVYQDMFATGEAQQNAMAAINALMVMMVPPEAVAGKVQAAKPAVAGAAAASRRSKRPTSSR